MLRSHSLVFSDFESKWYKKWAKSLKQTQIGNGPYHLKSNKFWQNAIMVQALYERGALKTGNSGIGFGVGKERLPALFASLGIKVTATDQDFTSKKAKKWDNNQLARGVFDLNEDNICTPDIFQENVTFLPVDMCNIPNKLNTKYDFVWSNCALGHLGSIPKGLKFIEDSLQCLKPGGWAVHTTEVNVLSSTVTSDSGATVVFRITDLYKLSVKLSKKGYVVTPFHLLAGDSKLDDRVSLDPVLGNDYSKIFINGHIASQMLLIIHKPFKRMSRLTILSNNIQHHKAYKKNQLVLKKIVSTNTTITLLQKSRGLKPSDYTVKPTKKLVELSRKSDQVVIEYVNQSPYVLTGLHESLFNVKHIILGTNDPINRDSLLATREWYMASRPSLSMSKLTKSGWVKTPYVKPGERFGFVLPVNPRRMKTGHTENFSVIQEGGGVIPGSNATLKII